MKDIFGLFRKAFIKASTMKTAINDFQKTGIYPCDRNVFAEADFIVVIIDENDSSLSTSTNRSAEQTNSTLSTYSFHEVLNDIGMMIGTEKMPVTHTCTESTVEVVNKENMPQRSLNMIVPITVTLSNSEAQNYPLVKEIS